MTRVYVICEGQTEEGFVQEVLRDVLATREIYLYPQLIGKPGHKGGNFKVERLIADLRPHLLGNKGVFCTTFFDFYGLPESFPGKKKASTFANTDDKAEHLLGELCQVVRDRLGQDVMHRFIPYIQMHEFEGLLFSDPQALANGIDQRGLSDSFSGIRQKFRTPEDINDSPITAPSKRIIKLYPQYEKPLHGALAALEIGLPVIRRECPLFDRWISQLEGLGS